jgi:hypothetical protein
MDSITYDFMESSNDYTTYPVLEDDFLNNIVFIYDINDQTYKKHTIEQLDDTYIIYNNNKKCYIKFTLNNKYIIIKNGLDNIINKESPYTKIILKSKWYHSNDNIKWCHIGSLFYNTFNDENEFVYFKLGNPYYYVEKIMDYILYTKNHFTYTIAHKTSNYNTFVQKYFLHIKDYVQDIE